MLQSRFPLYGARQVPLPPCLSLAFSRSFFPPFSLAPLVGRGSARSPSRSDSALLRIPSDLVLGGGFCLFRRDCPRSSVALSASYGGLPSFLDCPLTLSALTVAPLRPPLVRFAPSFWLGRVAARLSRSPY